MTLYLKITDGDLSVSWTDISAGFGLYRNGWDIPSAQFKSGGVYGNSALAHGQILKYATFDNVIDTYQLALHFANINDLIEQIDELEELLLRRAPGYWLGGRYNSPVWIERRLDGETQIAYSLINQGRITKPSAIMEPITPERQYIEPVTAIINRQPFIYGAAPGVSQKRPEIYALQSWDYSRVWAEEDTTPSGSVFCFAEAANGDIYAGGASEIVKYDDAGGTWAAETTTPVTLAADVTAAILLDNGDFLFGEDGRIIKLSSGTYSVETSLPSGQVWELAEMSDGQVYAADNAQILKRDTNGAWAVDSTLPAGQVYTVLAASNGRAYAGGAGEILRTVAPSGTDFSGQVSTGTDDAEEKNGNMTLDSSDLDFFNDGFDWIGVRIQNVTIPAAATITSAVVRFTAEDSDGGTAGTANIYCEDIDDAPTFTNVDNNISGRTLTTAYSEWTNIPSWVAGSTYDTADFTSALQEVINRAGWASGQDVAVIFEIPDSSAGKDRDADTYDGSAADAPQLIVTYTVPTAGTWERASTLPAGNIRSSVERSGLLLFGDDGQIISTDDGGDTFGVLSTTPTNEVRAMHQFSANTLYATDNGNILKSTDGGFNWAVDDTLPTTYCHGLWASADGMMRAGESGRILELAAASFTVGQTATNTGSVMVANHHKTAQLTHIFIDDGTVFGSNIYGGGSFPLTLLPAVPVVNDAIYFGCDNTVADAGPFNSLVFDIATPASSTTSYTIVWENDWVTPGSWVSMTVEDKTSQFSAPGINIVTWEPILNAINARTVNSVTAYWVRARVSAVTGTLTPPTQQTQDVYTVSTPYVELDSSQALGNIDSIAIAQAENVSDGNLTQPTNRLLLGVKPYVGFENFRAHLNFTDEQLPSGVTVDVSVDGDSATSITFWLGGVIPTFNAAFFDASSATLNELEDRAKITLSTTIASSYNGTYRAFIRGTQIGGSAGEVRLRLKVVSGSGGITFLTDTQATRSTNDHELIEFDDLITLPVSSQFASGELGDETSITLQIEATESDADFFAYDLFLLPVDHYYIDAKDAANTALSAVGSGERVTIDSITVPRVAVRGKAESVSTGLVKATYEVESNGELQLLSELQQRLWILTAQTQSAGTTIWHSKPEQTHRIKLWSTDRWLTGRGTV